MELRDSPAFCCRITSKGGVTLLGVSRVPTTPEEWRISMTFIARREWFVALQAFTMSVMMLMPIMVVASQSPTS